MTKGKNIAKTVVIIIVIIAVGIAGFFIGKSTVEKKYRDIKELDVLLSLSDMQGLGEIDDTIYITGHKSPDSDTVCSAIAYADLLNKIGYDAQPVVLGDINNETKFILEKAGAETPPLLEDASGKTMILVDHSEYTQSADGIEDAKIISIIDHHGDGSVTTGNQIVYDAIPVGSTATIIWMRYRNYGVDVDKKMATVLMGAVLSDTKGLQSNTTTPADFEAVRILSEIAGVENWSDFYNEMYKASISYEGKTDEEIFFSDYKIYEAGDAKFGIGCIEVYDEESAEAMEERMKDVVPASTADSEVDMAFAQISIFHDGISITYLIPSDEAAAEVIETAFPDTAIFDGTAYVINPGVSRKQVLVPAFTDILTAHPHE